MPPKDIWDKRTLANAGVAFVIALGVTTTVCAAQGRFNTPAASAPSSPAQCINTVAGGK
jgi:hypothetical protein